MSPHRSRVVFGELSRVTVEAVAKSYPGRIESTPFPALLPTSLELVENDFVTLLGPSGCGKTTLLRIIAGLEEPDTGRVLLDGVPVTGPGVECGMVLQDDSLFPWLTVSENVGFGLRQRGVAGSAARETVNRYIREVGLRGFEDRYPIQLPDGVRQRVALARALANDPKILLLDEPFGALDHQTRSLMQELLLSIWEHHRKTVLLVTHDIDEAIIMANRCIVLTARPGRIKTQMSIDLPYPRSYVLKTSGRFSDYKAQLTEETRPDTIRTAQLPLA